MITVINRHRVFNVMRGTPLGNKWVIGKDGTRDEVISYYKVWLDKQIKNKNKDVCDYLNLIFNEAKENDVWLECCCKNLNCHGDYIKEIIDKKLEEWKNRNESRIKN